MHPKNNFGFSLLELVIALGILAILVVMTSSIFINNSLFNDKLDVNREVAMEIQDIFNKILKEFRNGTIDYKGYYIRFHNSFLDPNTVVDYYDNNTSLSFPTGKPISPESFLSGTGNDTNNVNELMILSYDGKTRVKFRRETLTTEEIGAIYMTRENYLTSIPIGKTNTFCSREFDGLQIYPANNVGDTANPRYEPSPTRPCWVTEDAFPIGEDNNHGWQRVSSNKINVTRLDFIISPNMDPWKVYENDRIQIQPHLTMILQAKSTTTTDGEPIDLTVQTSAVSRIYDSLDWQSQ